MKLSIGSDHAGFEMKEQIKNYLQLKGIVAYDRGTYSIESTDYPDYAHLVAIDVAEKISDFGILLCGSANGVCMTANKHKGVRAALCWTPEIASLARQHNDANIICIPARFVDATVAFKMIDTFLKTEFEGGRHQKRVEKINV
ncbi:MAG: ribose 5-phosphate isomerase B [Bacteroidia bacterium]